jgi:hypothetical protein
VTDSLNGIINQLERQKTAIEHALAALQGIEGIEASTINTGWRNASFRGYADYMQTPGFEESLQDLIELAKQEQTAIMCAEAVPWRCHRSLRA